MAIKNKSITTALVISAFAIVPASLVLSIADALLSVIRGEFNLKLHGGNFIGIGVFSFAGLLISIPAALLYLLPIYRLLKRLNQLNLAAFTVAALLPALVIALFDKNLYIFLGLGYYSLCVAYLFWWLAPRVQPTNL